MSKKPPKKSDLNKAWMRAGKEKIIRLAPEYHLIVSEGTQTEPLYFGEIKKIINSKYRERIVLEVTGVGDNTENSPDVFPAIIFNHATLYKSILKYFVEIS